MMQTTMVPAALLILAFSASGQQPKPSELTALDYFQIQQLVAKYARAIDTCSNNGYDYADLLAHPGIDKHERLATAFNDQWAVRRVFGNIEIVGAVDLPDLVPRQHFAIRIVVEEMYAIAPDKEYPLIMSV